MYDREETRKIEALERELDLSVFRGIVEMKKEAEEFLKSHSVVTDEYRSKQNTVLNCVYLLEGNHIHIPEIDSIEEEL